MNITYQTKYINDYIKKNKITKTEFAKLANISLYNLNQILAQKSVGSRFIVPVVRILNISLDEFLAV